MKSLIYRLFHRPSFKHKYSSVTIYYCKKVWKPKVIGHHVYLPVRWFNADIQMTLKNPAILKCVREALMCR